jgi:hypothetical protein
VKGLEDLPKRTMEERVRDAFGAAAETATAEDLPGPPAPAGRSWPTRGLRAWAPRVRMHALVPIAAAACVTAIVVTATLVVPKLLAGPPAGALAGPPRFFAGVAEHPPGHFPPSTVLNIYRSATGRVVATARLPKPDHVFAAVARLGSGRTYVAAAMTSFRGCRSQLYRFSIDSRGRPSELTPLGVPQVTGSVMELVGSADGKVLAYTASGRCAPRGHQVAGVIHLATRQVTTWPYLMGRTTFGSVSLTADGSVLGFAGGTDGPYGPEDAWVLPTSSPSGPLTSHARKVLHVRTGVFRVVLSNTGSQAYVETLSAPRGGAVVLSLYSTTTGQRIRLLGPLDPGHKALGELSISVDAAGRHLLVYGYNDFHRMAVMNLSTGHLAPITVTRPTIGSPFSCAAW